MSSEPATPLAAPVSPRGQAGRKPAIVGKPRRRAMPKSSLRANGEPMIWLTGGALAVSLAMIIGLMMLVFFQGVDTFWPQPVIVVKTHTGESFLGEVTRSEVFEPGEQVFEALPEELAPRLEKSVRAAGGLAERRLVRTGNFELTGTHFNWVSDFLVAEETRPEWAVVVERLSWGRFYGMPKAFNLDGKRVAESPAAAWALFTEHHAVVRDRWEEWRSLKHYELGAIGKAEEQTRRDMVQARLDHGADSEEFRQRKAEYEERKRSSTVEGGRIKKRIAELVAENDKYKLVMQTNDGQEVLLKLEEIVRAYPANRLNLMSKLGIYGSRWVEFLADEPREANSEGGVYPAIFGTVAMTLLMSLAVVPFGVLAALYLREYAKAGPIVSAVRIAINNLAGVPSIVFGVFGLGFFCYTLGWNIDQLFFESKLPNPTYGTGGLMWASFTLALLTLPVVIVATEEALSAVPNSMREGSYACGAGKWQTIRRIVLPRAMPGIMTGMILAMSRGAGEVAPLMLVGAVKLAPDLVLDGVFPFVHPERSFMHLGFHIYDVGFQSQNSEAAKPMVYTTTLLLIALIALLNFTAVWLRARLRRQFVSSQF